MDQRDAEVEGRSRVWIAPFREGSLPEAHEWVGVTSGEHWDDKPRWSIDGTLMYSRPCATGSTASGPSACARTPRSQQACPLRQTLPRREVVDYEYGNDALEIGIARDQIFINLGELTGNIWTTSLR